MPRTIQTHTVGESLRQDAPGVVCRRLDGVVLRELVDEVVAGEAAYGKHQEPHEHEADRERAELEPAAPAPEPQPDGERGDRERDEATSSRRPSAGSSSPSAPSRAGSLR